MQTQRQTPTKSKSLSWICPHCGRWEDGTGPCSHTRPVSKLPVGETVERSDEAALHKSRDEIIHLIPHDEYERWMITGKGPIARCGFDCTGREAGFTKQPTCIVCIDLRRVERGY